MELIHIHETKPKSRSCCSAATPLPASPPCETPPPSASLATRRVTTAHGAGQSGIETTQCDTAGQ